MTQGDHVRINSKEDSVKKLPFLLKRVASWDYTVPLVIKLEQYKDERSLSQNSLFHIWCRQMSKEFIGKVPNATEEGIKFMMKSKFLGTQSIQCGSQVFNEQVMPLPKEKGAMSFFMDEVYAWAADKDVLLSLPQYNEYTELKRNQNA
tara:strand:- start:473 stop:916 length:444 start_codon:yes stop_codon:yes gene_type:complete